MQMSVRVTAPAFDSIILLAYLTAVAVSGVRGAFRVGDLAAAHRFALAAYPTDCSVHAKPMRQIVVFSALPSQFKGRLEKTFMLRAKPSTDELTHDRRASVSVTITISQRYLMAEVPFPIPPLS